MPRRSAIILATAAAAALSAVVVPQALGATTGCRVTFTLQAQWQSGFVAGVTMVNLGDPITGWTLSFDFAGNQRLVGGSGADWKQEPGSPHVTATNLPWNATLPTNQPMNLGFQATYSGTNVFPPGNVAINGVKCTGTINSPAPTTAATTTRPTVAPSTVHMPVIRLQGIVRAGVEMGCMLLDTQGGAPAYLLIGGDRTIIVPGAQVEVYGQLAPGTISFCMQGTPFKVLSVRRI